MKSKIGECFRMVQKRLDEVDRQTGRLRHCRSRSAKVREIVHAGLFALSRASDPLGVG